MCVCARARVRESMLNTIVQDLLVWIFIDPYFIGMPNECFFFYYNIECFMRLTCQKANICLQTDNDKLYCILSWTQWLTVLASLIRGFGMDNIGLLQTMLIHFRHA